MHARDGDRRRACSTVKAAAGAVHALAVEAAACGQREPHDSWPRCLRDDEGRAGPGGQQRSRKSPDSGLRGTSQPLFVERSPADRPSTPERVRVSPDRGPAAASRADDPLLGGSGGWRSVPRCFVVRAEITSSRCRPSRWLTRAAARPATACLFGRLLTGASEQASRALAGLMRFNAAASN